jgi:DNA-binding transcriptional LysR family regulator
MIETPELRFFIAVCSAQSLAGAARSLNVSPPAVSQRLANIESKIGLKLIERNAGFLRLTAEGELIAKKAVTILQELDDLTENLAQRREEVCGALRVVAPLGFGRIHIAPLMAHFSCKYPKITLDLKLTEDPRGTMRTDSWDLLIHVGRLPDLDIKQRKLAPNKRLLCAAPRYVDHHGVPSTPAELVKHHCGVIREDQADVSLWSLTSDKGDNLALRINPAFSSNDGEVVRSWAVAGLGIIERSEWSVATDLQAGRLIPILPDWSLSSADVIALVNPYTVRAARIEAFLEYLATKLSSPTWNSWLRCK